MASLFSFGEDNGTAAGSPPSGTTRTLQRSEVNWKNIDDSTTAYSAQPIQAGNKSYSKWQFGAISGTFNQVSNGKFGHTSGVITGMGLTLNHYVTTGYVTPAATGLSPAWDITAVTPIATSGTTVLFSHQSPAQGTGSTLGSVATGWTQFLVTYLDTTTGAAPGDTATVELTFQYDES